MIATTGQINYETEGLGPRLVELAARQDVVTVVEVGTWNGMGTTRCILKGLKDSGKVDWFFGSYECHAQMFLEAMKNNKDVLPLANEEGMFEIRFGKLVEENTISDWFDADALSPEMKGYLQQDIDWMAALPNLDYTLPHHIDLLVLDGGEFATYREWQLMRNRFTYCAMDDTRAPSMKCAKIREEVLANPDLYEVIEDNLQLGDPHRHGYLIIKHKDPHQ